MTRSQGQMCRPSRALASHPPNPGLTPGANLFRPFGAGYLISGTIIGEWGIPLTKVTSLIGCQIALGRLAHMRIRLPASRSGYGPQRPLYAPLAPIWAASARKFYLSQGHSPITRFSSCDVVSCLHFRGLQRNLWVKSDGRRAAEEEISASGLAAGGLRVPSDTP